ncbi:MAG: hypothetical protein GF317_16640 [Candidatus Lokiarchaeota archaeon]|nr:hypothetical protein [Candidatus Lokiarchaeota archaeon]MBD3201148.1 hypothetical protein [Candidatus Lokiarchaeota archaeon]
MNLKEEYKKFYDHWFQEFKDKDITNLPQSLFERYKNTLNFVRNHKIQKKEKFKNSIFEVYKQHFEYLFNDLLKLRKRKIINNALILQEIDLDKLIEPEKLLYQNLIASLKGFEKLMSYSIQEGEENIEIPDVVSHHEITEMEKTPKGKDDSKDSLTSDERALLSQQELNKTVSKVQKGDINTITSKLDLKEEQTKSEIKKIDQEKENDSRSYQYTLIRFIKKAPALVGLDLLNYGPFKKDDLANLPVENAKILITEKFAENVILEEE